MLTGPFRNALQRYTTADPFEPYVIEFLTRDRIILYHPEAVVVSDDLARYVEPLTGEDHFFDASSVSRLMSMRRPEPADPPADDIPF